MDGTQLLKRDKVPYRFFQL
ncbi:hypothetical protein CCACVL1_06987 [Corchorus capsularis]|uniref:Uncharacterized protein n=1 Tax=Corchorus capsularis TaxID=210143 RepID=A0A1R3JAL7_COCAP|nr:hypothetical protein CCACVL1_06987 [Corchorus capsularis]